MSRSAPTLYTFGYLASRSERIITELIAVKTPIVDIRFSPSSRRWQYNQSVLSTRSGIIYHYIGELGNELYKEARTCNDHEPHVKLHDPECGLVKLQAILETHGRAALLCACASHTRCHRSTVADLARERLEVKIIHL